MAFDFEPVLDSLEEVPANFHTLYTQAEGGKFTLEGTLAKKLDVTGLRTALDKERKNARTASDALKGWQGLQLGETPEQAAARVQEWKESLAKGSEGKVNWDKMAAEMKTAHDRELGIKQQEIQAAVGTVERYLVESAAATALAAAKGSTVLLMPHVKAHTKVIQENGQYVVRVVDKDGDPRGDGNGGYMTIEALVAEMKSSTEFGRAFESSGQSGSGKQPGSSKQNGGATGSQNLTPVQKISRGLSQMGSSR